MANSEVRRRVRDELLKALADVQAQSRREVPAMDGETIPLQHLDGFDSLCGVETIVTLEERLEVTLDKIPFVAAGTYRPLKVDEIVDEIISEAGPALEQRANDSVSDVTDRGGT